MSSFDIPAGYNLKMAPKETPWDPEMARHNMAIIENEKRELFAYNPFLLEKYGVEMHPVQAEDDLEMITKARWYQYQVVPELKANLRGYENFNDVFKKYLRNLLVLPTGAGKTLSSLLIFADSEIRELLTGSRNKKVRVLFVAHRNHLLTQAIHTYEQSPWVEIRTQMAKTNYDRTFVEEGWDITIIDEAHHEAMKTIQVQLEFLVNKPMLLLTATPNRKDGLMIKADKQISTLTREDAETYGFLSKAGINSILDYNLQDKIYLVLEILEEFVEEMGQTIIFTQYVKDVERIEAFLRSMGYNAIGISGKTSKEEETEILEAFGRKEIQFVINCSKLDEGIDVPSVDTVFIGRNYNSYNQINQVVGRVVRPDSPATVWQLVNPFKETLDASEILAFPLFHRLHEKVDGVWEYDDMKIA